MSIVMLILTLEPASRLSRADSHSILVSYVRRFRHKWRSRYPDLGECFLRFLTSKMICYWHVVNSSRVIIWASLLSHGLFYSYSM
jgi:hypothetical protein